MIYIYWDTAIYVSPTLETCSQPSWKWRHFLGYCRGSKNLPRLLYMSNGIVQIYEEKFRGHLMQTGTPSANGLYFKMKCTTAFNIIQVAHMLCKERNIVEESTKRDKLHFYISLANSTVMGTWWNETLNNSWQLS